MPNPVGFSHYSGLSGGSQPRRSVSNVRIVVWDCRYQLPNLSLNCWFRKDCGPLVRKSYPEDDGSLHADAYSRSQAAPSPLQSHHYPLGLHPQILSASGRLVIRVILQVLHPYPDASVESLIMSNPEMDAFKPVPPNKIRESPDICMLIHASVLFIVLCTIQLGTLEIHIFRLAVIISIKSTAECCNILDTAEIGFQERTKRRHGIVRQFNAEYISARYQQRLGSHIIKRSCICHCSAIRKCGRHPWNAKPSCHRPRRNHRK